MKWSEQAIARALVRQTFNRKYLVVVPNCNWTGHECDLLVVTENLRIIDVEIKISRSDLKADAKKDKWWHRQYVGAPRCVDVNRHGRLIGRRHVYAEQFELRDWPRKVWKHYYALPKEIWRPELLAVLPSPRSGVLLLDGDGYPRPAGEAMRIECVRRATANRDAPALSPAAAVDIARLASLRMWDAYARLESKEAA